MFTYDDVCEEVCVAEARAALPPEANATLLQSAGEWCPIDLRASKIGQVRCMECFMLYTFDEKSEYELYTRLWPTSSEKYSLCVRGRVHKAWRWSFPTLTARGIMLRRFTTTQLALGYLRSFLSHAIYP